MPPETLDVAASIAIQSVDTDVTTATLCNHGSQLTVIAILLSLVAALLLYLVFFHRKSDDDDPNRTKCPVNSTDGTSRVCPRILKRDFYYVITIFLIIIIFVLTHLYVGNDDAMNYFSFASTVASIVLSVLAIMMTIFSDAKTENTKALISKSVEDLSSASQEIQKYTDAIQKLQDKTNSMNEASESQKLVFERILNNSTDILAEIQQLKIGVAQIEGRITSKTISVDDQPYKETEV